MARNLATPSHSPFDGERPSAAGPGPTWRSRQGFVADQGGPAARRAGLEGVEKGSLRCDMTTGGTGEVVSFPERLAGVERRYGPDDVVARSVRRARPEVERCIAFVEGRLREATAR
jgi:hypothetical protein